MLVSTRVHTFSYIGETKNIHTHLNKLNSGFGSHMTCPLSLRPYALFAYVCGFEGNKLLRRNFEEGWKKRCDEERTRRVNCLKQISRLSSGIISQAESGYNIELRMILNFEE